MIAASYFEEIHVIFFFRVGRSLYQV